MGKTFPRLAIIGCGAVVEQFHMPALKKNWLETKVLY